MRVESTSPLVNSSRSSIEYYCSVYVDKRLLWWHWRGVYDNDPLLSKARRPFLSSRCKSVSGCRFHYKSLVEYTVALLSADYMLDVIGAGAMATCTTDWHQIWKAFPEAARLDLGIDGIHKDGQSRHVASTGTHSEFAGSWVKQLALLTQRGYVCTWRNPMYIYAKLFVFVAAGLSIGFPFFRTTNSLQGSQDKLFLRALHVQFQP